MVGIVRFLKLKFSGYYALMIGYTFLDSTYIKLIIQITVSNLNMYNASIIISSSDMLSY